MKSYPICMEIAGPFACFTDPLSGSVGATLPVPTRSAVRQMFRAVHYWKSVIINPIKVEICSPIQMMNYTTNYNGVLRKPDLIKDGNPHVAKSTVLCDVCYKLYASVFSDRDQPARVDYQKPVNSAHGFQQIFNRRLAANQCYRVPYLGKSDFLPSYVGPLRESTSVLESVSVIVPVMVLDTFDNQWQGRTRVRFATDVKVNSGVLTYA